jgi:hypothetical protein
MKKSEKKDTSSKGKGAASLPPDIMKFAKQLGLDMHGLEPEAQHIWKHLEKLSTENPVEYERFIAEQMALAKEEEEKEKTGESKNRSFRPTGKISVS